MIVRPSPHKRQPADKPPVQWPPKSPFQALVSSPGGRQRWQELQDRLRERSRSPTSRQTPQVEDDSGPDILSEEDEESLKLKLDILETKERLRVIQKRIKKEESRARTGVDAERSCDESTKRLESPFKRRKLFSAASQPESRVEVPVSPRKIMADGIPPPVSPARARLGLAHARAQDVSLKRGTERNRTRATVAAPTKENVPANERPVSSFSQRLADLRQNGSLKQAKSERLEAIRHKSFTEKGVQQKQPHTAQSVHTQPGSAEPATSQRQTSPIRAPLLSPKRHAPAQSKPKRRNKNSKDQAYYDAFSEIHLESRKITHTELAQTLAGSEIYTIPRLLKEVKAPEYETPDCESDFVVFGIVGEKSAPVRQRSKNLVYNKNDRDEDAVSLNASKPKFMVLRLCDLKWELDCYLFGSGFDKYWKLTEGTLIALLNPSILPPKSNQHSGKFSLKVASSDDCILEIGTARDIGHCAATRKDSTRCTSWINKSKAQLCEFHLNLQIGRTRKGRMEVNDMWRGRSQSPPAKPAHRSNVKFDAEHGQIWGVGGYGRSSAASLLDDETEALHQIAGAEASRKRIAAAQKDRELAGKLFAQSGGVAGEYFRIANNLPPTPAEGSGSEVNFIKPTAADLGLLGKQASSQRLSPAKDRRRHFGIGAVSSAGLDAMGWGGARKPNLLQPAAHRLGSPERGQTKLAAATAAPAKSVMRAPSRERSLSPRKKARFNLAQGIRSPGRESGGRELRLNANYKALSDDNDDDDLDII